MNKQPKNLSLSTLKKQNTKTYKDKKRIHFENGDKLDIDVVFQPMKIEKVIKEIMSIMEEVNKRKINKDIDEGAWLVATMASIIKNFTSIETNAIGLDGLIELSEELKNAEYYDQIVESFDESELNKTFNKINVVSQRVVQNIDLLKEKQGLIDTQENADEDEEIGE